MWAQTQIILARQLKRPVAGMLAILIAGIIGFAAYEPHPASAQSTRPQVRNAAAGSSPRNAIARAERRAEPARPFNRSVLALYDSEEEKEPDNTRLHRMLEMPLNHLGYRLTYWDLRKGLPSLAETRRHGAIATWFGESIPDPAAYLKWAKTAAESRVRFLIMDFPGVPLDTAGLPSANAFLSHLGLTVRSAWIPPSADNRVVRQNDASIGFERKLEGELPGFMAYRATRGSTRSHVVVSGRDGTQQQTSHPVVTGPGGGFAAYGYAALYDQKTERMAWVLNPFEFLTAALGDELAPVPDTTTLVGRRIYYSHIDGDGWNNITQTNRPGRSQTPVSEIVLEDLIKPYPDLPVAIGLISGDVDTAVAGKLRASRTAREYFGQPQVEVASHSYTHPYNWGAFAVADAEREAAAQLASTNPLRAYVQRPFELDREIRGSLDVAMALAPAGKRPSLFLWSGNTRPFAEAVRATRTYGVRNLNGGDSRVDSEYPSIIYLSALSRQVGDERQIYSSNANETIYTNGWRPPFDRFKLLGETLERTETPRRLKPFNIYYHMYSGEHEESLAAVKQHLDLARASPVVPIHTSHYAAIADAFFDVSIVPAGADSWIVSNRGALQTLRFDKAAGLQPDYGRSTGVLGHTVHAGSLYVALDPAQPRAVLAVTRATASASPVAIGRPVLVESRWPLSNLQPKACGFEIDAQGFGPGQMVWSGLRPGPYAVTAWRGDKPLTTVAAAADTTGRLVFTLEADAIAGVRLVAQCR